MRKRWTLLLVPIVLGLVAVTARHTATVPPVAAGEAPVPAGRALPVDGPPNIVVVMADDMRVDDLLFAPRLRRLVARRGVTFRNS